MILPPFPLPSKWNKVNKIQGYYNEFYWLAPPSSNNINLFETHNQTLDNNENKYIQNVDNLIDETKNNFDNCISSEDTLILNEDWAKRFSKTISKMKKKIHKSRSKMKWKNRK